MIRKQMPQNVMYSYRLLVQGPLIVKGLLKEGGSSEKFLGITTDSEFYF